MKREFAQGRLPLPALANEGKILQKLMWLQENAGMASATKAGFAELLLILIKGPLPIAAKSMVGHDANPISSSQLLLLWLEDVALILLWRGHGGDAHHSKAIQTHHVVECLHDLEYSVVCTSLP